MESTEPSYILREDRGRREEGGGGPQIESRGIGQIYLKNISVGNMDYVGIFLGKQRL